MIGDEEVAQPALLPKSQVIRKRVALAYHDEERDELELVVADVQQVGEVGGVTGKRHKVNDVLGDVFRYGFWALNEARIHCGT